MSYHSFFEVQKGFEISTKTSRFSIGCVRCSYVHKWSLTVPYNTFIHHHCTLPQILIPVCSSRPHLQIIYLLYTVILILFIMQCTVLTHSEIKSQTESTIIAVGAMLRRRVTAIQNRLKDCQKKLLHHFLIPFDGQKFSTVNFWNRAHHLLMNWKIESKEMFSYIKYFAKQS